MTVEETRRLKILFSGETVKNDDEEDHWRSQKLNIWEYLFEKSNLNDLRIVNLFLFFVECGFGKSIVKHCNAHRWSTPHTRSRLTAVGDLPSLWSSSSWHMRRNHEDGQRKIQMYVQVMRLYVTLVSAASHPFCRIVVRGSKSVWLSIFERLVMWNRNSSTSNSHAKPNRGVFSGSAHYVLTVLSAQHFIGSWRAQ